ncbi:hypothetical protein D6C83_01626 [Aureobasidium pullulans]|uniref:Uncharacterized protein n=1 Tax=Aureobasidium pullulans TaxID=5580 RepID=A0A4T0E3L8_AURPU|nr:hypothetical protein D6C83_01626 [Aureobasidium pullulans]
MVMPPTNREYLKRDAVEVPNDPSQPKKRMLFALNTRGLGPLDPPSSPPNGDFHNLNHFRAVRDRDLNVNTTGETYNYTGHTGMRHIMELDDHGGRNHQLLEIHHKLYPITRTVMGKDGLPVKTRNGKHKTVEVMAWKIVVKDINHLAGLAPRPFQIPVHGVSGTTRVTRIRDGAKVIDRGHTYHFGEDCCSTEDICPTIEQARNLGNIVCKILNKYPHNLLKDVKERDHVQDGRLRTGPSRSTRSFHQKLRLETSPPPPVTHYWQRIILYFAAVPKRARVHRIGLNRGGLFDEAHDDPNAIVNPRCTPQGLGTFTYLQPGELQLDEREARKLGLDDARATTDARIAAYLKANSKAQYPFGETPTYSAMDRHRRFDQP